MTPHAPFRTASIAALLMLSASAGAQAQTEGAAATFALTGTCLEQSQQLSEMVERDLVDVTEVSSDGGSPAGGWELPGGASDAAEADPATSRDSAQPETETAAAPAPQESDAGPVAASTTTSTAQAPGESEPLLLTMADGSTINLGPETEEALEAVPQDNWFGQSPDVETAKSYLASAAEMAEAGNEEACLESLNDAKVALGMDDVAAAGETVRQ